jgi:purine catabolism regulator
MRLYRESIGPLREHDRVNKTQYALTLKTYLESLHKARTAQELFIHRQTLAYRLNRIREITGRDPENPDDRLTLEFGFAVEAYLSVCAPHRRL